MIKDYLYALGKYLPFAQRKDILREIEANLYDYLEKHYGEKKSYSEKEMEEAIMSLGSPQDVALGYLDRPRALIGPPLLDLYYLLLRIVLPSVALGLTIAKVLEFQGSTEKISFMAFDLFSVLWNALLSVFGMMTLIFALVYHFNPTIDIKEETWSVRDLEKAPVEEERVKLIEVISETILSVVFFLVITSLPKAFPINFLVFESILPLIYSVLLASVLLNLYLLVRRKWQLITRLLAVLLDFAGLYILGALAFTNNVFDFTKIGLGIEEAAQVNDGLRIGLKVAFIVVSFVVIYEGYRHIRAQFLSKR